MTKMEYNLVMDTYKIFKSLSNKNRLRIVVHLYTCKCSELGVVELSKMLNISQSLTSKILKNLLESNIVISETNSRWRYYKLNDEFISNWKQLLDSLIIKEDIKEAICQMN